MRTINHTYIEFSFSFENYELHHLTFLGKFKIESNKKKPYGLIIIKKEILDY